VLFDGIKVGGTTHPAQVKRGRIGGYLDGSKTDDILELFPKGESHKNKANGYVHPIYLRGVAGCPRLNGVPENNSV